MKFGVTVVPRVSDWKLFVDLETMGYDAAWAADSQMLYSDAYATLALAAVNTSRIRLGTGVSVAGVRLAPVTAHSIATINQLAPGRTILGIGTGFTGRNTMGLPPVPLGTVREYVRMCRALLRGEEVLYREGARERWIRFLHPDHGYINLKDPIPIYLAANGPKALELTGAVADGWLTTLSDPASFAKNLARVKQGAAGAGRTITNFPTAVLSTGCVLRPGESITSPRVVGRVGPLAVVALHALWERSAVASDLPEKSGNSGGLMEYLADLLND